MISVYLTFIPQFLVNSLYWMLGITAKDKQEQIVLERSARLNLDPGRGDLGDRGDG